MNLKIEWPQLIYTALLFIGWGVNLSRAGQPKTGNYGIAECLLGPVVALALLWWGGFYG